MDKTEETTFLIRFSEKEMERLTGIVTKIAEAEEDRKVAFDEEEIEFANALNETIEE